jgi:hypothetical protein
MPRRSLSIAALVALLVLALAAVAFADVTKKKSKTVSVSGNSSRTVTVTYPDALKFGDAKYRCSGKVVSGDDSDVTIRRSTIEGGSACRARIRNDGSRSVKVKVTATTIEPSQEQQQGY